VELARRAAAIDARTSCRPDDARRPLAGGDLMPAHDHPLLGKWRIVEMALWDADFLDLVEPAYIVFDRQGRGEFVFGAVYGSLDCRYGRDGVAFTWQGSDEMDPACGDGDAELDEDGSLVGEIRFHGGDESAFKAHRW
jgi:hypothetical protein